MFCNILCCFNLESFKFIFKNVFFNKKMLKMDLFYYVNIFVYVIIRSENDKLFVVNYIKIVLNFELFYYFM